jgi:hypothetical protein
MLARLLHYASIGCCLFVTVSFGLFALDQAGGASSQQAAAIAPSAPIVTPAPSPRHGQPRRFIDGVAGKLTSPFDGVVASSDGWVQHGIPALLALLVYGAGLGFLGRWASGLAGDGTPAGGAPENPYA